MSVEAVDQSAEFTLKFKANPLQYAFITSRAEADLWACRMGEGKSTGLAWSAFHFTQANPGAIIAMIRDTFENLRDTTMKDFFEWFPPGICGEYNANNKLWKWRLGEMRGEIMMMGMDDPGDATKLQSRKLGGALLDEPAPAVESGGISEAIFDTVLTRLRQPNMAWYMCKLAENAPDETHWTYRRFVDPGDEGTPPQFPLAEKQKRGFAYFQGERPENAKHLPPGYYAKLRHHYRHRPDYVRRFADGGFGFQQIGRPVTPQWSDALHLADALEPVKGVPLMLCWDWGLCYDDKTEILTEHGWKKFEDVSEDEVVATLSPETKAFEYQQITNRIVSAYNGRMLDYENDTISFCVTPEHLIAGERERGRSSEWLYEKEAADSIFSRKSPHFRVITASDSCEATGHNPIGLDDRNYAELMGWYLSEGCSQSNRVTIYQSTANQELLRVLESTGMDWKPFTTRGRLGGYSVNDSGLAEHVRPLGTARTKRIPDALRSLSAEDSRAFLDSYIEGDGNVRIRDNGAIERRAFTVSWDLASGIQEVAQRAGIQVRIRWQPGQTSVIRELGRPEREIVSPGGWALSFKVAKRSYLQSKYLSHIRYLGMVYCVTVPNGTVCVRRNGKVHWNGNSPTCTITQITPLGFWNILECHVGEGIGALELVENVVKPRLVTRFAGYEWSHTGDPAGDTREQSSSKQSAVKVIKKELGGKWKPGPVPLHERLNPLHGVLSRTASGVGIVQVDKERAKPIWHALRGGWHYAVARTGMVSPLPKKDIHSHPGDTMGYGAAKCFPLGKLPGKKKKTKVRPGQARYGRGLGFERPGVQVPKEGQTLGGNPDA